MKNLITMCLMALLSSTLYAQAEVTFSFHEICTYDANTDSFIDCYIADSVHSINIFSVNAAETEFKWETGNKVSKYYVYKTNHKTGFYEYHAFNDVREEFVLMFDIEKSLFKVLFTEGDEIVLHSYIVEEVEAAY